MLLPRYKDALNKAKATAITSQGVLSDPDLMAEVLAYYRYGREMKDGSSLTDFHVLSPAPST